jgi:hypothetical protein
MDKPARHRDPAAQEAADLATSLAPALRTLVERGILDPTLFAVTPAGRVAIPLRFESSEEKAIICDAIGRFLRQHGVRSAVFATEAWMAPASPDDANTAPPSRHPDRREALLIVAMAAGTGWAHIWIHPFRRHPDGRVSWDPPQNEWDSSSITVRLFASYINPGH